MSKKNKYSTKASLLGGLALLLPMSIIPKSDPVATDVSVPPAVIEASWPACLDGSAQIPDVNAPQGYSCISFPLPWIRDKWDNLADCETGDRYYDKHGHVHFISGTARWTYYKPGFKYMGGLQMDKRFWSAYGGLEFAARPDLATIEQQKIVAARGIIVQPHAFPWCTDHGALHD